MAQILKLAVRTVKASSLIEVIVALVVLISIVFITAYFLAQMSQTGFDIQKKMKTDAIDSFITKTIKERSFKDEAIHYRNYIIEKKATPYHARSNLTLLTFTLHDSLNNIILKKYILQRIPDSSQTY